MEDNEFTPKSTARTEDSTSTNTTKKESKATKPAKEKTADRWSFASKFDTKRFKVILGSSLTLLSIYLFLACLSYLFTWTADQDRILQRSFVDYIFDGTEEPVQNWLGKFGAWTSHFLIYRLFGVTSFVICFLMFISGIRILFDYTIVPLGRAFTISIAYMIWGSVFLGFFSENLNYLGGTFGFYLNEWLLLTLGSFGAFALSLVFLYVITTLIFNPNYSKLLNFIFSRENNESESEAFTAENENPRHAYEDIFVVNTIKDEEIKTDVISETVDFSKNEEEDEDVFFEESELSVSSKLTIQEDDSDDE